MTYDEHEHDRALDAEEARMDAAIAREGLERASWLKEQAPWLLTAFAEANPDLWAQFQQQAWDEYIGGEE